ncbi:hypothetical protein V8C34DRAFT_286367 [Trichoderma compactum]
MIRPACHSFALPHHGLGLLCCALLTVLIPSKTGTSTHILVPLLPPSRALAVSVRRQRDALVLIPPPDPTLIYFYGVLCTHAFKASKGKGLVEQPESTPRSSSCFVS